MWPDKNAATLIKDRSSAPSSKWYKIPCTLKRKSFKTFVEAEAEAAEMSGHTDSDSTQPLPVKKFRTKGAAKQILEANFNEMTANPESSVSSENHHICPPSHDHAQSPSEETHSVQTLQFEQPQLSLYSENIIWSTTLFHISHVRVATQSGISGKPGKAREFEITGKKSGKPRELLIATGNFQHRHSNNF
nr:uncharacterized protein LOC115269211 [Aedes albopictus]